MPDYTTRTIPELEAELFRLGTQLASINDTRLELANLIVKRKADSRARERVRDMTPLDRDALKAALDDVAREV